MIEVKDLSFSYYNENVLNEVTFSVEKGALYTVIGLNGAGKSTLFGCLAKLLEVPKGKVFIQQKDITDFSYREYSKVVSYVPQLNAIRTVDCVVRDYMVEGRTPYLRMFSVPGMHDYEVVEKVAKKIGIERLLGASFSELSGGQQQLVSIARALVQDTPIIFFDEPMSALDLCNQSMILKLIRELKKEGKTILFSSHNPNHAISLGAGIIFLKNGKVMRQERADSDRLYEDIQTVYGDAVILTECGNRRVVIFNTEENSE